LQKEREREDKYLNSINGFKQIENIRELYGGINELRKG
jgi:hypothetical protein